MKRIIVFIVLCLLGKALFAQDIITTIDGNDIQVKVTEVGPSHISYKKFSNLDGPTYTMNISDVRMITYENGEREVYVDHGVNTKSTSLPQGIMTYNSWSGKVSVGGVTMENEFLEKYFTQEDYNLYKGGKVASTVGGVIGIIGAIPFGAGIGILIGGGKANVGLLAGGGVAFLGGLLVNAIGASKVKKAINNYNASIAYQPEIHLGVTTNGVGLAFVF